MTKISKLYWKIRKILQPEFVEMRNNYIRSNIDWCIRIKESMPHEEFDKRWGKGYIEEMYKDLV